MNKTELNTLTESITAAPEKYMTAERVNAEEILRQQQAYVQQLSKEADGTKKNSPERKAFNLAVARRDEMQAALKGMEPAEYSAANMVAHIIADAVNKVQAARENQTKWLGELAKHTAYTLEWHMDDIIAAEVVDQQVTFFIKWLRRISTEKNGYLSLSETLAIWNELKNTATKDILRVAKRASSRSSSTQSNLVEDLTNQAKANLFDDDGLGRFSLGMAEWMIEKKQVRYDEGAYPINWDAVQAVIDTTED